MALRVLACLTLFLLVPGQAALACKYQPGPFLQQLAAVSKACTHSLCGRIYPTAPVDPATAKSSCSDDPWMRFRSDVTAALSAHGALLLGEMHDNPAHHLLQAAAVTEFAVSGSTDAPAIVFEQIRDDQQAGLVGGAFVSGLSGNLITNFVVNFSADTGFSVLITQVRP